LENECYNGPMALNEAADAGTVTRHRIRGAGLHLAVNERGDPSHPTVVLVHGFPNTSAVWEPVARHLCERFHVVTYDVRGAGDSDVPGARVDYALAILVEDMGAVIAAVSPGAPVHLVAHDWGSIQGWEAVTSADMEGRIASYTSISGPPIDHAALWARQHRTWRLADLRVGLKQAAHSWYIGAFHLPYLPALVLRVADLQQWVSRTRCGQPDPTTDGTRSTAAADFAHGLELYRANVRQRLRHPVQKRTDTPVQIIVPTKDRYITPSLLEGLEAWSSLTWRRNIDAGHWLISSHADRIAEWVGEVVDFVEAGEESEDLARARLSTTGGTPNN
jgi:pimeloyl-ACP methyl ester carboxylesterase